MSPDRFAIACVAIEMQGLRIVATEINGGYCCEIAALLANLYRPFDIRAYPQFDVGSRRIHLVENEHRRAPPRERIAHHGERPVLKNAPQQDHCVARLRPRRRRLSRTSAITASAILVSPRSGHRLALTKLAS